MLLSQNAAKSITNITNEPCGDLQLSVTICQVLPEPFKDTQALMDTRQAQERGLSE